MMKRLMPMPALKLKRLVAVAVAMPFLTNNVDAYGCLDAVFGGTTSCGAQDVKFYRVVGFQVTDSLAEPPCNCNCGGDTDITCSDWSEEQPAVDCGTVTTPISCWSPYGGPLMPTGVVFGACLGTDDNVNIALTVDLIVSSKRYDVAMYINVDGGSAKTGTECAIVPMVDGTYGDVTVATTGADTDGDDCPDFTTTGTLTNFSFASINLQCIDLYSALSDTNESDGLLDFDIAISWQQNSRNNCNFDGNDADLPKPGSKPKCWLPDRGARINIPIYIPPYVTPTSVPSSVPSESTHPTSQPSLNPSMSAAPSEAPSSTPSHLPSLAPSSQPSSQPSLNPSISTAPSEEPSNVPSHVPSLAPSSEPSSQPSSTPSHVPSLAPSSQPSSQPSLNPSLSTYPTSEPSLNPSISTAPSESPSSVPSHVPSLAPSSQPSSQPSLDPSVSVAPSLSSRPSASTEEPSSVPSTSSQPSKSAAPSSVPSLAPSVSLQPSSEPSFNLSVSAGPSGEPSRTPSSKPSLAPSSQPSSQPSLEPSASAAPSLSSRPSSSTEEPSPVPSTSSQPSQSPSLNPTISSRPSSDPTGKPTDQPSFPPTGSPYYPDWINTEQVCINDGATPEYMKILQRANYLYMDKQECCEEHFSWRVRQCMGNDEPVFYRDGSTSTCKKGDTRDDYDIAFDTLAECCKEQVWWDEYGCLQSSPKVIEFEYTLDLEEFAEPTNCQDTDAIAKRMQDAMAPAMPSGTFILVVGLGGITIENDVALGTTQCGGSISGGYQGDYSTASDHSEPPGTTTSATFRVSVDCPSSGCTDNQSVKSLYDTTLQSLLTYAQGSMTQDIVNSADISPAVPQLKHIVVDSTSMAADGEYTNPLNDEDTLIEATSFTVEGELSVTDFDTSSFDAEEKAEAIFFFQAALETTLESEGLSYPVKVTDIVDGKIMYETFIAADSSSDASAAASSIETELANDATRASIASNAASEASNSSIESAFNSGFVIDANTQTAITEIPVAKLIVEGQFLTNQVNFGSSDESYLEKAIYEVLLVQGVVSEGGRVEVTGYDGGLIIYEVISYVDSTSNVKSKADSIASQITQSSTTGEIAIVANSSPGCCTLPFVVLESTYLSTSGVPSRGWWPDWDFGERTCTSHGKAPAYMSRNYDQYFSESKRECCQHWFPYNLKGCVGQTIGESTKEYFVPNWVDYKCNKRQEGDMDEWELADTFESLEVCCKKRFPYSFTECCSASGSDECSLSSEILYFPREGKCVGETVSAMEQFEIAFSESSVRECCASNFWWKTLRVCCIEAGGC